MRIRMLVVAAALAACGCSAQAAHDPVPSAAAKVDVAGVSAPALADSDWRFIEVAGVPVPHDVTASLRLRPGHASGKAGCNAYGATWGAKPDGHVSFGAPRSTRMACLTPAGAMQVERAVFTALARSASIRRDGDRLVLLDATGKPLATLLRMVAEP